MLGILFLILSFLVALSVLEQSLSAKFMKFISESTSILLWVIIPFIVSILSLLIVGLYEKKLTLLVSIIVTLLLISNMTFLVCLSFAQMGFGIILIVLFVWGSVILFVIALLVKLTYSYFFMKNIKEVIGDILKVKILKLFLLSGIITFMLLQLYLMGSAIEAYKAVKVLNIKESKEQSLLSFYKPYIYEIRLSNGMRWSYVRVKFVNNGR